MLKELTGFAVLSLWILVPLVLLIVGAVVVWVAVSRTKTARRKLAAGLVTTLVVVLIPTWDEIAGRAYFRYLCDANGGTRIYKRVTLAADYRGIQFPSAPWLYKKLPLATSYPYGVESIEDVPGPARIYYVRETVRDSRTGEILATATNYFYRGGWFENAVSLQGAGGGSCGVDAEYFKKLLEATFEIA